jgi:methionyl-tRNA formyltransferase
MGNTPKILFMGTPQFAVPVLDALAQHFDVVAVVTQPDAPAGRGRSLLASPVKQYALQRGLPILQPASLKPPEVVTALRDYAPDAIVVAAFGQILRRDVLTLPPRSCVNVHASLLPRWRGAAPISAAIAAGDQTTGVTIMLMEAGVDSGPILSQRSEPIRAGDTTASLTERLSTLGAQLLVETLPRWLGGEITPQRQDEALVTKCGQLKKEEGRIDWSRSAAQIERHVRAMIPWPVAWTTWQGKQLQVKQVRLWPQPLSAAQVPGAVFSSAKALGVQCGEGALELLEVQLEGKRSMPATDFMRGQQQIIGAVLA